MNYTELIVALLTGLATAIPLVIKLIQYIQESVKEKNWCQLLELVKSLMETAEQKFEKGTDKKEWVLMMVKASSDSINYDIDLDKVSTLIDSLTEMTNKINIKEGVTESV